MFSRKGIALDPQKAISPTTASGVHSFLGMATYCAKLSAPPRHQQSFRKIKQLLTSAKVMVYMYFNPGKETELTTDASPTELSAILVQKTPERNSAGNETRQNSIMRILADSKWSMVQDQQLPTEYQETNKSELTLFTQKIKDELTVNDGSDILLKSSRIVVPTEL